jgi:hypothetical protein
VPRQVSCPQRWRASRQLRDRRRRRRSTTLPRSRRQRAMLASASICRATWVVITPSSAESSLGRSLRSQAGTAVRMIRLGRPFRSSPEPQVASGGGARLRPAPRAPVGRHGLSECHHRTGPRGGQRAHGATVTSSRRWQATVADLWHRLDLPRPSRPGSQTTPAC